MSNSRISAIRSVVRSVVANDDSAASDRELLRRFSREGNQGAFETLVNRHSNMVLAKRAKDGRWQESVANWLFATARQVAYNARLASERRAKRETRAAVPEA